MTLKKYILFSLSLLLCECLFSQVKTLQAYKTGQAPKIDGNLDDAAWKNAPIATDFIDNFPTYGIPSSTRTVVRIMYDNNAIYVGAYLYDNPSLIKKQITSRDVELRQDVDYFSVFFDTYGDHQNGFQFTVTTANVQSDAKLGPNLGGQFGEFGDKTWDAVWESQARMKSDGWVVEMRIPYLSLRFAKKAIQDWNLDFLRFTRRNNETSFWNAVDPQLNGFVNQFGLLEGLRDIQPPLRLSFSPYVSTGYRSSPVANGYVDQWLRHGGMDVKYGVNESFTLDATLIPDFGQVVSDNVVNNLTPYEVKFQENRPFFTEGTEIFNKAGLFYSRRVGSIPSGYYGILDLAANDPNIEILKNPATTQLYNAIKFSGRTRKKLGIGIFNAITSPMHARIRNKTTGEETSIETEPLANYNIIVLDQAFSGQSYLTFTNTNVIRGGMGRDANVTALDLALYDKQNTYGMQGTVRYSKISGANPYDGYNTTLRFGKVSGAWQYNFQTNIESEKYDPNDLGILFAPNEVSYRAAITYKKFTPTKTFLTYTYGLNARAQYLYNPYAYNKVDLSATAFLVFHNFWDITMEAHLTPGWEHNYFELRTPDRYLSYPTNLGFAAYGSTDSRKKWFFRFSGTYGLASKYDNKYYAFAFGLRYRFSNKFNLDFEVDPKLETNQLGYAFSRETNGDPIVGFRDNHEFVSILTGIYNFNSKLNLSLRARHYWDKVNYISFHDVDSHGYLTSRGFIPNKDENFNAFNIDAFLTWDFRLGSRLILGYKNWLGDNEMVAATGKNTYFHNLGGIFDLQHGNEFSVRFIYFLDYNQLRKKK